MGGHILERSDFRCLSTGPFLQFPILFVVPVGLAAWYCGPRTAYTLAVLLPMGRLAIAVWVDHPSPSFYTIANALVRMVVLILFAYLISRTAKQTRELKLKVESLVKICSWPPLQESPQPSAWPSGATTPTPAPHSSEKPALRREVVSEILSDCIDLELWEQGRKVAGEVQSYDWLEYREAAGRFWLAHAVKLESTGDVQSATAARFRMMAIWPEGESVSRNSPPFACLPLTTTSGHTSIREVDLGLPRQEWVSA